MISGIYNSTHEFNYIDASITVDFFDVDSYEVFDIELFIAGEDIDGFTWFEESSGVLFDSILYDGEELIVEFDILPNFDWPTVLYLFITGEFSEDTAFGVYDKLDYGDHLICTYVRTNL